MATIGDCDDEKLWYGLSHGGDNLGRTINILKETGETRTVRGLGWVGVVWDTTLP